MTRSYWALFWDGGHPLSSSVLNYRKVKPLRCSNSSQRWWQTCSSDSKTTPAWYAIFQMNLLVLLLTMVWGNPGWHVMFDFKKSVKIETFLRDLLCQTEHAIWDSLWKSSNAYLQLALHILISFMPHAYTCSIESCCGYQQYVQSMIFFSCADGPATQVERTVVATHISRHCITRSAKPRCWPGRISLWERKTQQLRTSEASWSTACGSVCVFVCSRCVCVCVCVCVCCNN